MAALREPPDRYQYRRPHAQGSAIRVRPRPEREGRGDVDPEVRDALLEKCDELLTRLKAESESPKLADVIRDIEELRDRLLAEGEAAA